MVRVCRFILWYIFNLINNKIPPNNSDENIIRKQFTCDIESSWPLTEITSSPPRKLSDLFWINLPWQEIKQELGSINILDIGCGTGSYGEKILKWSNGLVDSYTGIDVFPRDIWKKYNEEYGYHFFQSTAENFLQYISCDTNFFISQSALEHIEEDLSYFEKLSAYLLENKKQAIQVHLIPSEICLDLYGVHGGRQYSIRSLGKICKLFSDYSYCIIYSLGGDSCNRLHYNFITKPLANGLGDLRDIKTKEYDVSLKQAIQRDFISKKNKSSFYALIIHSNPQKDIFNG